MPQWQKIMTPPPTWQTAQGSREALMKLSRRAQQSCFELQALVGRTRMVRLILGAWGVRGAIEGIGCGWWVLR